MSASDQDVAGVPEPAGMALPEVPMAPGRWADEVAFPPRDRYHELVAAYRADGFEQLSDLTAVDYLTHPGRSLPPGVVPERFEVVVTLLSLSKRRRVRVRVQVPADAPEVDTLWDLYPGAEAMEREVFDLFGVRFAGHPDLTRILMPEDWEGHPLRKDYGVGRVPVQFKEAPGPR
jgi:NADH-quinone oxidoreductase subunit C